MAAAIRNVVCGITARKSGLQRMGRCHTSNTAGPVAETAGDLVETQKIGHVYMVGINRLEVKNCVDPSTASQLLYAFKEFERQEDLWVAVLYGKGGCFCSGYDLKSLATLEDELPLSEGKDLQDWRPMGPTRMSFTKPVIAAVGGYAVAGGLELAAMCDLRIMEETAQMGVLCRRWGVPLLDGGTIRLPKLIGLSRALDLILTGRLISAQEALQFGLANRIVPDGTAVGEAVKLAQRLCQFPQDCMRADRASAYYSTYDAISYDDAFQKEWQQGSPVVQKESVKGAQSFTEGAGRHASFDNDGAPKPKL